MIDAPYRHESDTSREAAARLTTADKNRNLILDRLREQGEYGITIDEMSAWLEVPPNAISGRFSELVEANKISKTPMRRNTRSDRAAVVYVLGGWASRLPPAPVCPPALDSQLEKYKAQQAAYGHGHVIPRNDGKREPCGGPSLCKVCRMARAYFESRTAP